jgi:hypothetical protein
MTAVSGHPILQNLITGHNRKMLAGDNIAAAHRPQWRWCHYWGYFQAPHF